MVAGFVSARQRRARAVAETVRKGQVDRMIRHVVLARIRPDVPRSEREAVFGGLADLRSVVPMLGFSAGPNSSPEGLDRGYTDAVTIDFADAAARDAYLAHPAHQAAGERLVAATEGGLDGLCVVDFEV